MHYQDISDQKIQLGVLQKDHTIYGIIYNIYYRIRNLDRSLVITDPLHFSNRLQTLMQMMQALIKLKRELQKILKQICQQIMVYHHNSIKALNLPLCLLGVVQNPMLKKMAPKRET